MSPWEYLLQPAILFFLLWVLAVVVRSDLEIPGSVLKILSLYLLFALGFKGGTELQHTVWSMSVVTPMVAALIASFLMPWIVYPIVRRRFDTVNAAAIAATYGSVSAVTFMTTASYLDARSMPFGGYMVAAMALMESPAILSGLVLARRGRSGGEGAVELSWASVIHECLANKSVLVLLGSLFIGLVTPESGSKSLQPFVGSMFPGMLCFFLLDLGIVAARRISDLKSSGIFAILFALAFPVVAGGAGLMVAKLLGMSEGDGVLFALLCGSGSYIAVPAAFRSAVPDANPSIYVALALGVTFPFNLILGIPLAYNVAERMW